MEETGITLKGIGVSIRSADGEIRFSAGEYAKDWLTDPLRIADGRTVGQMNQDILRQRLDEWIESQTEVVHG